LEIAVKAKTISVALALAVALTASACSHAVRTQSDAVAAIDAGIALNARPGTYRISDVTVSLAKVVALQDGMLGLRFSFDSDSATCCSLFPRVALPSDNSGQGVVPSTSVVVPTSDVAPDGTLKMTLWEGPGSGRTRSFTVDLSALDVSLPR
jgi:hypothetical protein